MLHAVFDIFVFIFIAGAYWKVVVHDTRQEHDKLVGDILSGVVTHFVCGGIVYGDVRPINDKLIAACPVAVDGMAEPSHVILDTTDITRPINLSAPETNE